jgi:hypothetical protein
MSWMLWPQIDLVGLDRLGNDAWPTPAPRRCKGVD